ncbi:MAG: UMP kinase [Chloroflexi bacterium]|nr:UMP kinase [Chloroflexota bacterium]
MAAPAYQRAVLKLSGESLRGDLPFGLDWSVIAYLASEVKSAVALGVQLSVVVGGGNIWRGTEAEAKGMDRATADYAGMLATVINALALQDAFERQGVETRTMTAIDIHEVAEPYIFRRALHHLESGIVVIFAAGTGNPYMTTDTTAALRAAEMHANVLLMAKYRVDGVYDADPRKHPEAKKFDEMEPLDLMNRRLEVMDSTALSLCMENDMPVWVFDIFNEGSLGRILSGEHIGTLIHAEPAAARHP